MTEATTDAVTEGGPGRRFRDEGGWVTLWVLGLAVMLLALGGLSLDLWRAFGERRDLAGMVDAAAVAGASGVDTEHFRATGEVVLDPAEVDRLVADNLAGHSDLGALTGVDVATTREAVTVSAVGRVELTLTRVLIPAGPLTIRVDATARPTRAP